MEVTGPRVVNPILDDGRPGHSKTFEKEAKGDAGKWRELDLTASKERV